jgi:hypothetical protein
MYAQLLRQLPDGNDYEGKFDGLHYVGGGPRRTFRNRQKAGEQLPSGTLRAGAKPAEFDPRNRLYQKQSKTEQNQPQRNSAVIRRAVPLSPRQAARVRGPELD